MIIETENLSKRFLAHQAVRGIDLKVPEGAAVALVGANGAGKTTTLRLLLNILRPGGGQARVMGTDSRLLGAADYARIGYVSENQKLPPALTLEQYFAYLRTLYPTWDSGLEADLIRRFDLPARRPLGKLSHGMRMKAALASALPFRPKLLVLDEPLSGLDPLVRDEVMEGLLGQAEDMTILISSHELAEIEGAATHIAFMDKGRLVFQQSMDDLYGRFREVTALLPEGAGAPADPPPDWINVEAAGPRLSFVHTAYTTEADLAATLTRMAGPVQHLDVRPMPLRAISKALMLQSRREAAQ